MEDLKNIQETMPSEEDDNYGGLPWFGKSYLDEEPSSAGVPNESSSVPGGDNKPGKGKGVSRSSGRSRKSLPGDESVNGNQPAIRHLKVNFSDAEYYFLKAAALSSFRSIGAYVRDCVLAELKTKKEQDRVRDFFDADLF